MQKNRSINSRSHCNPAKMMTPYNTQKQLDMGLCNKSMAKIAIQKKRAKQLRETFGLFEDPCKIMLHSL
jgi:hypothetical protein